jgi:hypothetical protein
MLNGAGYTIIGVMPSRFGWRGADVWIPLTIDRTKLQLVSIRGRLKAGVTIAAAAEQLRAIHQGMAPAFPRYYPPGGFSISIHSLRDGVIREFRTTLHPVCRGDPAAAHRVRQRGQSATREGHRKASRNGDAPGNGSGPRAADAAVAHRKPYALYTVLPGAVRIVLARTERDPLALGAAARTQVSAMDKDQVVSEISTVEQELKTDEAQPRFSVILTTAFAVIGLLLATVGIYGVVSYTFSRRTQEIGVRMALGAEPAQIIAMVLRSGLRLALGGIALGSLGAWCVTRLIKHLLYKVSAADPWSFSAAAVVLAAAALAACYIPARRAARTNPQDALRWE